ncbi:competence protein CoiA family protein [Flavobacterium johnsoniae]|uniref:Competence protein CoiA nuclease-like domain-containing protein n=1 Tax=Flavobacterium johnsoniae (strain ATCC 17061 / DSM 2064 / JCM 8514 / BCRC 14874 / CCUG 350202 / NBRC 14942 / NCIMB 11054 / UW101) TaxID=376686 RepID=A5FDM2_FLAJ1|nr:hypothetical protein [Flavobacterium johnsoniae]ABQ06700.1 hypothetical protein Fjoh_3686 [Flavobacterium johnsoniae UW101]OXE99938.1 hypothetical protein B0A63_11615 [Flavobacterium johnsoniae UW101]WQG82457.1 hypothetical protein SR927_04920 [Flavobacterium johnsoniae UW101]SHM01854.1 hypothetical protein SAMN05444146_5195 [Flavobacterium johnsoniae]
MSEYAVTVDGELLDSNLFEEKSWDQLKKDYKIGDLKMICCGANAVPKTSIKYNRFFAHQSIECTTAPETIWHKTSKKIIVEEFSKLGFRAIEEQIGNGWIADVYVELDGRKIAIELQQSPQTLKVYFERQKKYSEFQIEAYWLLFPPRYLTIIKAIKHYRLKNEFNNKCPNAGFFPSLNNLPVFYIDDIEYKIKGVGLFNHTIEDFVISIVNNKLSYLSTWYIEGKKTLLK